MFMCMFQPTKHSMNMDEICYGMSVLEVCRQITF
jgi:hypothetical protein